MSISDKHSKIAAYAKRQCPGRAFILVSISDNPSDLPVVSSDGMPASLVLRVLAKLGNGKPARESDWLSDA